VRSEKLSNLLRMADSPEVESDAETKRKEEALEELKRVARGSKPRTWRQERKPREFFGSDSDSEFESESNSFFFFFCHFLFSVQTVWFVSFVLTTFFSLDFFFYHFLA
jgi:hypothetical protein